MKPAEVVGQAVKMHREQAGLTQAALSEAVTQFGAPMEPTTVLRVENGRRQSVRVDELLALAAVLGVAPADLLAPRYGKGLEVGPHLLDAAQVLAWLAGDPRALERRTRSVTELMDERDRRGLFADVVEWLDRTRAALDSGRLSDVIFAANRTHIALSTLVDWCISDQDRHGIAERLGIDLEGDD